jgi:fatty-acyl-CoA synthase
VIDIDDPQFAEGAQIGDTTYEEFIATGDPTIAGTIPPTNGTRSRSTTPRAPPAIPRAWSSIIAARRSPPTATPRNGRSACIRSTFGRCRCSTATAGAFPWTWRWSPGTSVCLRRISAKTIYDSLVDHDVTHMCGAPIIMQFIIGATPEERRALPRKVEFMTAAAPPPAAVLEALEKENFRVTHVYGLTEVYGPATVCAWHDDWDALDSGERARLKARQGVRYAAEDGVTVMDPVTMEEVPRDASTMGEVMFRGNLVMKGYLKNPKATREAFADGWFHSGDLGVLHEDGYIELRDRSKDIIISGGENISTIEVEGVIIKHPAVANVAVVAKPDEKWGETPCAFVVLKPAHRPRSRRSSPTAAPNLASYKCPRFVVFRELPMTSTGKVQKYVLRDWAKAV